MGTPNIRVPIEILGRWLLMATRPELHLLNKKYLGIHPAHHFQGLGYTNHVTSKSAQVIVNNSQGAH